MYVDVFELRFRAISKWKESSRSQTGQQLVLRARCRRWTCPDDCLPIRVQNKYTSIPIIRYLRPKGMIQNMLFTIMQWSLYSGLPGWRHRVPASNKVFVQTILGRKKRIMRVLVKCFLAFVHAECLVLTTNLHSQELACLHQRCWSQTHLHFQQFYSPWLTSECTQCHAVDTIGSITGQWTCCTLIQTWMVYAIVNIPDLVLECVWHANTLPFCHFNQQWILQLLSFGQWRVGLYHNTLLLTVGNTFIPCEVRVQLNLVHCRKLTLN